MSKNKNKSGHTTTIHHSFTGHRLTQYSGLSPIHKYYLKTEVGKKLLKLFPTIVYNASQFSDAQLIQLFIYASLCKVNRLSQIETFSTDPLVKNVLGLERKVSDSSLSARFSTFGEHGARKLEEFGLRENRQFLENQDLECITIDMDSTVSITYGNQEGAAKGYNPQKKGANSYHPLLAFVTDYKLLMHTWFRPGSAYTSNGSEEFVKQIIASMPKKIKKIFFRMDSGFFDNQLLYEIEQASHEYLVKVKFKGMYKLFELLSQWEKVKNHPEMSVCEFTHPFTVIDQEGQRIRIERPLKVLRTQTKNLKGSMGEDIVAYEYVCYCSNKENQDALQLHQLYKPRAESENWIEQVKNQLLAGKTIIDDFWANDIFWQLSSLAYNLSVRMRIKVKKYWRQEYNTFRDWFVKVPGMIVESGRRIYLKIYSHYYFRDDWEKFDLTINSV